jgi:hypothetical protein
MRWFGRPREADNPGGLSVTEAESAAVRGKPLVVVTTSVVDGAAK